MKKKKFNLYINYFITKIYHTKYKNQNLESIFYFDGFTFIFKEIGCER